MQECAAEIPFWNGDCRTERLLFEMSNIAKSCSLSWWLKTLDCGLFKLTHFVIQWYIGHLKSWFLPLRAQIILANQNNTAFPFLFSHWIKRCLTLNEDADKIRRLKNSIFGLGRRLVASSFEEYSHTCLQFHKWSLWTEAIPVSVTVAVTALCWQFSPHSLTVDHSSKKMINVKEWQSFNQIQIFVPIKRARQASLLLCCALRARGAKTGFRFGCGRAAATGRAERVRGCALRARPRARTPISEGE